MFKNPAIFVCFAQWKRGDFLKKNGSEKGVVEVFQFNGNLPPKFEMMLRGRNQLVKVSEQGNVIYLQEMAKMNLTSPIKVLDKDNYIYLPTGEVKEFDHKENRADDGYVSLRRTFRNLRALLNTNCSIPENCRFVTLTYAENMTDPKKLDFDVKNFMKRIRQKYLDYQIEYISIAEPQGRGAWHCHIVLIFDRQAPFIPNNDIWAMWSPKGFKSSLIEGNKGYDFTSIKRLDNVDNVGAYLTAYLGDLPLDDADNLGMIDTTKFALKTITDGDGTPKRILKGARLQLYPPKFNLYRCSKGIKKPSEEYLELEQAEKKVSTAILTFDRSYILSSVACCPAPDDCVNIIRQRYYNTRRKITQD